MKKLLILGGGTGGTISANLFSRKLNARDWKITVLDNAPYHLYQPGLLFLPFALYGYNGPSDVTKEAGFQMPSSVEYVHADIKSIDPAKKKVGTSKGDYEYDWLISSLGARIAPEEVPGLGDAHKNGSARYFYTLDSAMECQKAMADFKGGKLLINVADMPVKCPVAPIEFAFLADYYLSMRGLREKTEIIFSTPLAGAFTKPLATKVFGEVARQKGIKIVAHYELAEVDPAKKILKSHKGDELAYDLLISIPPNIGSMVIEEAGLGNGIGFIEVDNHTLLAKKGENIFGIGDNTTVPTSKAGSVTHFESEVLVENFMRVIEGKEPEPKYDGHSNCFIESGHKKALLIDFNYQIEPLPGKFPIAGIGPFTLLKETRVNHMGKMAFRGMYWNGILKGAVPGESLGLISSQMSMSGKTPPADWKPPTG